ncbi:hypothetical protein BYT27DRAFT_7252914 [Phlegmacium glaucopus]|nr:hypothetical protein BYT27DRAFT_7252914 [Phlegmacium glaucopus]
MPAIRSKKKVKGKTVARPKRVQKEQVDPCGICGFVVSRKGDIPRHAMRHASEDEKLPCPWEGCTFRTFQKSNLDTHYRRHTQDKHHCKDDPDCEFQTCDPASLLRHRKREHGYIPRATPRAVKNPHKHSSVRIIRGIKSDSVPFASRLLTFPSVASTSSSTTSSRCSPDSLSPSPSSSPSPSPPPSPSSSPPPRSRFHRRLRSFSPEDACREWEVPPSPSTPVASTSNRKLTPERSTPTVLSMNPPPICRNGKKLLFADRTPPRSNTRKCAWGFPLDLPLTSSSVSPGLDPLKFDTQR